MTPPEICPHCGALVPPNSRACPTCGSDEKTGWSEHATLDRLGVPSEDFDYEEFLQEEFGSEQSRLRPRGISRFWWLVAILCLLAFFLFFVL